MADITMLLNTQFGNLSALFASDQTLWSNRGYDVTNIFAVDNTFFSTPVGNEATFGGQVRFRIRKAGGKVHKTWLKLTIDAGVLAGDRAAAYVDDLAAAIVQSAVVSYASKTLHAYDGQAVKPYRRLMENDIFREAYNAMAFAGLPPGSAGESVRIAQVTAQTLLYVPLDWLWFTRFEDYSLVPEALSSELDLFINYQSLGLCTYARIVSTGAGVAGVSPFTTAPNISSSRLFTQLIYVPTPEKNLNLMSYENDQGNLFKILDFEPQLLNSFSGAAQLVTITLNNFRLDCQFLFFFMRDSKCQTAFAADPMQSDTTPTLLSGAGSVNCLQPITDFQMTANGKLLINTVTELENRMLWREWYFKGINISEPIYVVPFSWLLRDAKNITSFQNMVSCHWNGVKMVDRRS